MNSQVIPSVENPARIGGALTTFVDITQARESHQQLQELASRDPLTDLVNRRGLYERIEEAASQQGPGSHGLGILFIDLDGLKEANDSHGHLAGDEVIVQSAARIRRSVRLADVVARFGGTSSSCCCGRSSSRATPSAWPPPSMTRWSSRCR